METEETAMSQSRDLKDEIRELPEVSFAHRTPTHYPGGQWFARVEARSTESPGKEATTEQVTIERAESRSEEGRAHE